MAGLGRGFMYDDWHGTRKHYPDPKKEIHAGLETYAQLQEMTLDDYYYSFDIECTCEKCIAGFPRSYKDGNPISLPPTPNAHPTSFGVHKGAEHASQ